MSGKARLWALFLSTTGLFFSAGSVRGIDTTSLELPALVSFREVDITTAEEDFIDDLIYEDFVNRMNAEGKEPIPRLEFHPWPVSEIGITFNDLPDYVFVSATESNVICIYEPALGNVKAPEHQILRDMPLFNIGYSFAIPGDQRFLDQLATIFSTNDKLKTKEGIRKIGPLLAYFYNWYFFGGGYLWGAEMHLVYLSEKPSEFGSILQKYSPEVLRAEPFALLELLPKGGVSIYRKPGLLEYTFYTWSPTPSTIREWIVFYSVDGGFKIKEILIDFNGFLH